MSALCDGNDGGNVYWSGICYPNYFRLRINCAAPSRKNLLHESAGLMQKIFPYAILCTIQTYLSPMFVVAYHFVQDFL